MITFERFEAAKIRRFVSRYKKPYTFKRSVLNDYKEPTDDSEDVCTISGVYHESNYKYIEMQYANSGVHSGIESVSYTPMIMCMIDDESNKLEIDDFTVINNKKYVVVKKKDINNSGFAFDISLRFVENATAEA